MSELSGKPPPAVTTKARGRRTTKIRVTTIGKPPLSGAEVFARLLGAFLENSQAAPAKTGGPAPSGAAPIRGGAKGGQ